jgi:hypothetical protein
MNTEYINVLNNITPFAWFLDTTGLTDDDILRTKFKYFELRRFVIPYKGDITLFLSDASLTA